jgi:hypothetical protein
MQHEAFMYVPVVSIMKEFYPYICRGAQEARIGWSQHPALALRNFN